MKKKIEKEIEERLAKFTEWFRKEFGTGLIRTEKEILKVYIRYKLNEGVKKGADAPSAIKEEEE
jgi:hypothetical protein